MVYDTRHSPSFTGRPSTLLRPRPDLNMDREIADSKHRAKVALYRANLEDFNGTIVTHAEHLKFLHTIVGEVEFYHRVVKAGRQKLCSSSPLLFLPPLGAECRAPPAITASEFRRRAQNRRLMSLYPSKWCPEVVRFLQMVKLDITFLVEHAVTGNSDPLASDEQPADPYVKVLGVLSQQQMFSDTFIPQAVRTIRSGSKADY